MIDPHTADGLKVAREHASSDTMTLVLETALPVKFAATIEEAIGLTPDRPDALAGLEDRPKRCAQLPADVAAVKRWIAEHGAP
jgi:threonine synthase